MAEYENRIKMSINDNSMSLGAQPIQMPADKQASDLVTAQHLETRQQPIFVGNVQQSPPVQKHTASIGTVQWSPAQPMASHRHHYTTSLSSTQQSLAPFSSHQHSPPYANQYLSPHRRVPYTSPYYNTTPYSLQPLPLYSTSSTEHRPTPTQFKPSQEIAYHENPQSTPQPHNQQSSIHSGYFRPGLLMGQFHSGYRPTVSPSLGLANPLNSGHAISDFVNPRSLPIQQPALPIEQPRTPTSGAICLAQGSGSVEGGMVNSPRSKRMKHLTCHYWHTFKNCRYLEDDCIYSHRYEGCEGIASKPIHKEPGKPAVAGKNAEKDNPDYTDWARIHAAFNPPRPNSPFHPKIQVQIDNIHKKYDSGVSTDPHIERLRQAEKRAIDMRAKEAAGAAIHQARLDARMKALGELIERLGGSETSQGTDAATPRSNGSATRSSSAPTLPPEANKAAKLDTDTRLITAADTSTVMTDIVAENQALRSAVQDLAQVVSTLMTSNVFLRANRLSLHDSLFDKILKLPAEWHDLLLRPFATSTQGFQEVRHEEEQARTAIAAIRAKMIEIGQGGLLTAWDRDVCTSIPRSAQD